MCILQHTAHLVHKKVQFVLMLFSIKFLIFLVKNTIFPVIFCCIPCRVDKRFVGVRDTKTLVFKLGVMYHNHCRNSTTCYLIGVQALLNRKAIK